MKRHTFALKVYKGKMAGFRNGLGVIWNELTAFLDAKGIKNFSIWSAENIIFGYFESEDSFEFQERDQEIVARWESQCQKTFQWISTPFQNMRLMYQDFGIVRESKELIRHRVFITRLKDGAEEEYKLRHDALVTAKGKEVTKGPDSNFSIWYAGGFIFGYNEIDTTMEHEMTLEEKEESIQWETGMLEIMSWVTNDVDWITGEVHENIKRLAWHG